MSEKQAVKHYIIQDSWNEEDDQELREYLEQRDDVVVQYMAEKDILRQIPNKDKMIFADSSVVQHLLRNTGAGIVDSYPEVLNHLYKRRILVTTLKSGDAIPPLPYFCKLQGSNKDIPARIVRTSDDHDRLLELIEDRPVYISDVVDFQCEFRLFCSPEKIVAVREYSEFMIGHRLLNADESKNQVLEVKHVVQIPKDFLSSVLEASKQLPGYVVVDVGLTSANEWCVVECNPPFALSSYDLQINTYVEYCVEAWQSLLLNSPTEDTDCAEN